MQEWSKVVSLITSPHDLSQEDRISGGHATSKSGKSPDKSTNPMLEYRNALAKSDQKTGSDKR
jgi:hypothetical protein